MINYEVWTNGYLIGHYKTDEKLMPHDIIKLNGRKCQIFEIDKIELDVVVLN